MTDEDDRAGDPLPVRASREHAGGARQRLLDSAADLFYREGVRAVGVDAIVASAGVAKASFYRHFRSKDDLVVAWLESDHARYFDRVIAEIRQRTADPRKQILAYFDVIAELINATGFRGSPYLNTAAELRGTQGAAQEVVARCSNQIRLFLEQLATDAGLESPQEVGDALYTLAAGAFAGSLVLRN